MITLSGGGWNHKFACDTATQVQDFINYFGSETLEIVNPSNIEIYITHISKKIKPSTVLFYLRALKRFTDYLESKDRISARRHTRIRNLINNMQSTFEKRRQQQKADTAADKEEDRLPAAARVSYLESSYVTDLASSLLVPDSDVNNVLAFRDYLLTAITFYNGHRPMVLTEMTMRDFLNATMHVVEGEEAEEERTYMSLLVREHKTSKSTGAAIISVPISLYRQMRGYYRLTSRIFGPSPSSRIFYKRRWQCHRRFISNKHYDKRVIPKVGH